MIITTLEHWRSWSSAYTMLPYVIKLELQEDRVHSWQAAWQSASPDSFVLESGKDGRYTFLGLNPRSTIRGTGEEAEISQVDEMHAAAFCKTVSGKALQVVKDWMLPYRSPKVEGAPKFLGGCVGFWGYDVIRSIEKLPDVADRDLDIPDYSFGMYDQMWIIDHEQKNLYVAVHMPLAYTASLDEQELLQKYEQAQLKAQAMLQTWQYICSGTQNVYKAGPLSQTAHPISRDQLNIDVEAIKGIGAAFKKEDFIRAVEQIQSYISEGDVFQVNLSVRQSRKLETSPEEIYESLRSVNPSPYMGLLRFSDFSLVSGSPELLVQLEDRILRTRPLAGTRPRGQNEQEDRQLAGELIDNEKERAEHVMLVDLERNDLGRIAKYGTVKVKDFMVIEYYSHVMHIVSEVVGELGEDKDAYDVIAAAFPGGTITGAPKIRTMEIIEELEPVRRGPYTGSMGWIDYNGNMEFNIIIRTLVAAQGVGYIQAGAGIVIDSVPDKEYTESLNKAKAMWKAIEHSERSMSRA
ncbi:anthranilate synthase component I family protein [Paenibacillus eucommiae]|uniref:Para-aminobenzoate synthetase component 1 n=1 Tax=Paenibacillus eucommiae TaxID=1355755 RepID=A0ABS4JBN7_9BACL|nr:anthranilate synthase component I family protein [Paenibacillus eucommiae]MBP1996149.1 para-aminobenzoate synthetase component 1 [Paenibacillus eucommiae]